MSEQNVKDAMEYVSRYCVHDTDGVFSGSHGNAAAILASEVTRLAALTPKVWDAETIKDAPEGYYWLLENGCGVCPDAWYRPDTKSEVMKLMLHKLEGMRGIYTHAFGPIPQPPVNHKGEA